MNSHTLPQLHECLSRCIDPEESKQWIFDIQNNVDRNGNDDSETNAMNPMMRFPASHGVTGEEGTGQC